MGDVIAATGPPGATNVRRKTWVSSWNKPRSKTVMPVVNTESTTRLAIASSRREITGSMIGDYLRARLEVIPVVHAAASPAARPVPDSPS